ncbi:YbjN domain-containing protein [Myxococcota bacterium]|nr:YbjN domain-containing protein [Myxococcota bacterium]
MSTASEVQRRVAEYLRGMGLEPGGDGISMFRRGTTAVTVSLVEDEGRVYVRIVATMLTDTVEPSFEVLRAINHLNGQVHLGAFILFDDHKLCFAATLLGEHLDREEFDDALTYVAAVGDRYDETLQRLAGGKRVQDVLEEDEGEG